MSVSKVDARMIFNDKNLMFDRKDLCVWCVLFMIGWLMFNEMRCVIGCFVIVNLNVVEEEERLDEDVDAFAGLADIKFVIVVKLKLLLIEVLLEVEVEIIFELELYVVVRVGDFE